MTDISPIRPRRGRLRAAAFAVAAAATTLATTTLPAGPAAAEPAPYPSSGPAACAAALPYGASASADLLRLHALDLPAVGPGPLLDVRVATTGAGMAADGTLADGEVAAAAAARDIAANLLGLDAVGLLPAGAGLGHTAYQQAPPSHPEPAAGSGLPLELGVLRAGLGTTSAHATWQEAMRCGAATGPAGTASASLVDVAVLPAAGGRALVALPENLASRTGTGLVERGGDIAAEASAAASLTDLRLFAGSGSEVTVRVLSEPELVVATTGRPGGSQVDYHAPVLEVSGPGIGTSRLETPGAYLDVLLPGGTAGLAEVPVLGGDNPLEELLAGVDTGLLGQLAAGADPARRPMELSGLPDLPGLPRPPGAGSLPALPEVFGEATVLRLSLGELHETVADQTVSAAAASLRVQLLSRAAATEPPTEQAGAQAGDVALLDLGIGLLEAAATAPALADPPAGPGSPGGGDGEPDGAGGSGCGGCPEPTEGLPVTGPGLGLLAGAGILLLVAGRFLLLATRSRAGLR